MFGSAINPSQMVYSTCFSNVLGCRTRSLWIRQRIHNLLAHIPHACDVNRNISHVQVPRRTILRTICKINNGWR